MSLWAAFFLGVVLTAILWMTILAIRSSIKDVRETRDYRLRLRIEDEVEKRVGRVLLPVRARLSRLEEKVGIKEPQA